MFVINAIMEDANCGRIRRHLYERGILVCDLERPLDGDPGHRRWLVGTFALAPVLMTLAKETVPVLYTERAQPLEVPEQTDEDIRLSHREQVELYGAERVCRTNSYKGSLLIAMAANEIVLVAPEVGDSAPALLDQIIERLGHQPAQWLSSN